MALTEETASTQREQAFRQALVLRQEPTSWPLTRNNTSSRITALAWAIISALEVGDQPLSSQYAEELNSMIDYVREVGRREPLFFCPITKYFASLPEIIGRAVP